MKFFDGRKHAKILDAEIEDYISKNLLRESLAIIMVGEDPASEKYVGIKSKLCNRLGIPVEIHKIDEHLSDEKVLQKISSVFSRENIGGGIIQLPLPRKTLRKTLELIPLEKDVDLISPRSQKIYYSSNFSKLSPVVRALEYFLAVNNINIKGMDTCVIGDGYLVGKPIAYYLSRKGAKNKVLSNYGTDYKITCQLLVLSAGYSGLVKGKNVVSGCHILDYGSSIMDGKVKGDLDLSSNIKHLGIISPSPGGVGPLVTRFLLMNFLGI